VISSSAPRMADRPRAGHGCHPDFGHLVIGMRRDYKRLRLPRIVIGTLTEVFSG